MLHRCVGRIGLGTLALICALLPVGAAVCTEETAQSSVKIVPLHTLRHSRSVTNLAWSPEGRLLATTGILSADIAIWDARSGKLVRKLRREIGFAEPIAFSPDGRYLITSAAEDRMGAALTIWERGSWKISRHVSILFPDKPPIWSAARLISVATNRSQLAYVPDIRHDSSIAVLDTINWKKTEVISSLKGPPVALAFAPEGRKLAVGSPRGDIFIVDLPSKETQRKISAYPGPGAGIAALAFSNDGNFLASGHNGLLGARFTPDRKIEYLDPFPDPVRVWRVSDGALVASALGNPSAVRGLAWSPDGRYLAFPQNNARTRRYQLRLWDIRRNTQSTVMEFSNTVFTVSFSPDGKYLAGVGGKIARIVEVRR